MRVVVLGDGETWTQIQGCFIVDVDTERFPDNEDVTAALDEVFNHGDDVTGITVVADLRREFPEE